MDSTRALVLAIFWFLLADVAGGTFGLVAGRWAMPGVEPLLGDLAGGILLVSVPLGLFAGGLLGAASFGWLAASCLGASRPAIVGR